MLGFFVFITLIFVDVYYKKTNSSDSVGAAVSLYTPIFLLQIQYIRQYV
ncbi:hypothetical protein QF042_004982 [Pedobacter sp. W3I1]|nr:hypothetical protein [Pedobacter sp. W3I1]